MMPIYDDEDRGLDLDSDEELQLSQQQFREVSSPRSGNAKYASSGPKSGRVSSKVPVQKITTREIKPASSGTTLRKTPSTSTHRPITGENATQSGIGNDTLSKFDTGWYESKIEKLEELNQTLYQQLEEKDKHLSQILQENINIKDLDDLSEAAAKTKITALVKKNKSISLAFEKEKTKSSRLTAELLALQQPQQSEKKTPVQQQHPEQKILPQQSVGVFSVPDDKEIRELRDAHAKLARNYTDTKDKLLSTQTEIKNLKRVLAREVGDSVDIEKLADENSNWKGRAQQITILKAKIRELSGGEVKQKANASAYDDLHRESLVQIADQRRQEFDRMSQEYEVAKEELQRQKTKTEAQSSRIKILEAKVHELHEKLKVVLDKTEDDDQLITLLQKEIQKLKKARQIGGVP